MRYRKQFGPLFAVNDVSKSVYLGMVFITT
jgi:hypothetical protein